MKSQNLCLGLVFCLGMSSVANAADYIDATGIDVLRVESTSGSIKIMKQTRDMQQSTTSSVTGNAKLTPKIIISSGFGDKLSMTEWISDIESSDFFSDESNEQEEKALNKQKASQHSGVTRKKDRIHIKRQHESIEVWVPNNIKIEARSRSGAVIIGVPTEKLKVGTLSGAIMLDEAIDVKQAKLVTVSGDIFIKANINKLSAKVISGDVKVAGMVEHLEIISTSGDLKLRNQKLPRKLQLKTVSGDLDLEGELLNSARYQIKSMSGDVDINLSNQQGFTLESSTRSGKISVPSQKEKSEDCWMGCKERYVVDGGGAEIEFESFSGDLDIRR